MEADKIEENYLRRKAKHLGLFLKKSRASHWSINNHQGYMIMDPWFNRIELGEKFELSLEHVAQFLESRESG